MRLLLLVRPVILAAGAVSVSAISMLGGALAHAATSAGSATLRDRANDVRAGDLDLTSISVAKTGGNLVVRFTVRRPITDNVSYTASVKQGTGSWALVARRSAGVGSFVLYDLSSGLKVDVTGAITGRTATIRAPLTELGQTDATLGRVQAYFRAEPANGRSGQTDSAATTGRTVFFCLRDRHPRPMWGPCIWPGQIR
jgi:hypothetical protein